MTNAFFAPTVSPVRKSFDKLFAEIQKVVPFNPAWNNGTGYMNHAVTDKSIGLAVGDIVKFVAPVTDEPEKTRKGILIGTPVGNVVIFQRYIDEGASLCNAIVFNAPMSVAKLVGASGTLSDDQFYALAGGVLSFCENIGYKIDRIIKEAAKFELDAEAKVECVVG